MGNNYSCRHKTNKASKINKMTTEQIQLCINQIIHDSKTKPELISYPLSLNKKNKIEPIIPIKNNAASLYSIASLSHELTFNYLQRQNFHSNNSLYSTAIIYSNKENKGNKKIVNSTIYRPAISNLLNNSLTKDNPNITIRSNLQQSLSSSDDIEHFDHKFKLRNTINMNKKNSSCEELNSDIANRKKASKEKQNEFEMTIGLQDDKVSIGREYKENIVIKEENENMFYDYLLRTRYPYNGIKNNKRKVYKAMNKRDRFKKTLTFSHNIRKQNQCIKLVNINYKQVNKGMYINESFNYDSSNTNRGKERCQTLPHEKSFCYFLLENRCNINEGKRNKVTQKKPIDSDTISYKVDLKSFKKITNNNNDMKNNNNMTKSKPKMQVHHKRFISLMEHLMEINPNNRSTIIKSKINKQSKYPRNQRIVLNELYTDTSSRKENDVCNWSNLKPEDSSINTKEQKNNQCHRY